MDNAPHFIPMITPSTHTDVEDIHRIINDAAIAYKGIIPEDRWHEPYMPMEELKKEIGAGVVFSLYKINNETVGVMGIQDVKDVTLIRHAYVATRHRNQGIGKKLLSHLLAGTKRPVLIGTWKDASWAVAFYCKNGFAEVSDSEKRVLLKKYWTVPDRQIDTSTVLAQTP